MNNNKTGMITVDHIVYLNSILGLNKVVGTNEDETVDYTLYPQFYDFSGTAVYNRAAVVGSRPRLDDRNGGDPNPGVVPVLVATEFIVQNGSGDPVPGEEETISVWEPVPVTLFESVSFREWDQGEDRLPNLETATFDIGGFAQSTDDNLSIIEYVHTFQIPENR